MEPERKKAFQPDPSATYGVLVPIEFLHVIREKIHFETSSALPKMHEHVAMGDKERCHREGVNNG